MEGYSHGYTCTQSHTEESCPCFEAGGAAYPQPCMKGDPPHGCRVMRAGKIPCLAMKATVVSWFSSTKGEREKSPLASNLWDRLLVFLFSFYAMCFKLVKECEAFSFCPWHISEWTVPVGYMISLQVGLLLGLLPCWHKAAHSLFPAAVQRNLL